MSILLIALGFAGLLIGGEFLVRGAVAVAERLRLSPIVIGITLVGFGTSMPELLASVQAALVGAPGIAVGNVVGSNIANILLILGAAAAIRPVIVARGEFRRDGTVLALATLLCLAAVLSGTLGRGAGLVFLAGLAVYIIHTIRTGAAEPADPLASRPSMATALLCVAGGLVALLVGARALVSGAVTVAADLGVSEAVIGLTVVAIGTSMPELITSILAARRGQSALAFGNIVGSNIFNILGILGVTALVHPLEVPSVIAGFDIWVMLGATTVLMVAALTVGRIARALGVALLIAYAAYLGWLVLSA
ncbi:calcium/sodium antiporter [uncultured Jannaschia sp.]|uniref:calcium/sodium antiporter n=1 Tax=uncultured Jannaschia sp. TaxID=293347 RepID=UPI00263472D4|nr:calcium/sodium antiporter [uncultured Jannaschia sp.]